MIFAWGALAFVYWAIALRSIPRTFLDLGGDSAQYIIVAESIAAGAGYRMSNYPGEPVCTLYPPVFPLLLSPLVKIFGRNFFVMHLLVALLGFLGLMVLYRIFVRYASRSLAFLTVLFISLNWCYLAYSAKYILSEVPYIFFSCLGLWALSKYIEKESHLNKEGIALICCLLLAYFTRAAGMVLFFAAVLTLWFSGSPKRLRKIVFVSCAFLPFFAAWNIFKILYRTYVVSQFKLLFARDIYNPSLGTLFDHPGELVIRLLESVSYYAGIIAQVVSGYLTGFGFWAQNFIILLLSGMVLLGLWQHLSGHRKCVFTYYFLLYFLLLLLWPAWEGPRFLLPVVPFLIFYIFTGLKKICGFINRKFYPMVFACAIAVFFLANILSIRVFIGSSASGRLPQGANNFVVLHRWIQDNLKDKGVIISRKPTVTYFYANHQAVCYPYSFNPEEIWQDAVKNGARYLIVDEFSKESYYYLSAFLYKYKDKLDLLHRIGDTAVFKINISKD